MLERRRKLRSSPGFLCSLSLGVGGRPVPRCWLPSYFWAMSLRCQAKSVSGVTRVASSPNAGAGRRSGAAVDRRVVPEELGSLPGGSRRRLTAVGSASLRGKPAGVEMNPKSDAWCQRNTPVTCHETPKPDVSQFAIDLPFQKDPVFGHFGRDLLVICNFSVLKVIRKMAPRCPCYYGAKYFSGFATTALRWWRPGTKQAPTTILRFFRVRPNSPAGACPLSGSQLDGESGLCRAGGGRPFLYSVACWADLLGVGRAAAHPCKVCVSRPILIILERSSRRLSSLLF